MEDGETCICQYDDWYTAFGPIYTLHRGMRLTVSGSRFIAGTRFYSFKETPEDTLYLCTGFKPMRSLN
jgi:hypothetical protein